MLIAFVLLKGSSELIRPGPPNVLCARFNLVTDVKPAQEDGIAPVSVFLERSMFVNCVQFLNSNTWPLNLFEAKFIVCNEIQPSNASALPCVM